MTKEFKIVITETYSTTITVNAEDENEAMEIVENGYYEGEYGDWNLYNYEQVETDFDWAENQPQENYTLQYYHELQSEPDNEYVCNGRQGYEEIFHEVAQEFIGKYDEGELTDGQSASDLLNSFLKVRATRSEAIAIFRKYFRDTIEALDYSEEEARKNSPDESLKIKTK